MAKRHIITFLALLDGDSRAIAVAVVRKTRFVGSCGANQCTFFGKSTCMYPPYAQIIIFFPIFLFLMLTIFKVHRQT